jgi:carbonic anhydrase
MKLSNVKIFIMITLLYFSTATKIKSEYGVLDFFNNLLREDVKNTEITKNFFQFKQHEVVSPDTAAATPAPTTVAQPDVVTPEQALTVVTPNAPTVTAESPEVNKLTGGVLEDWMSISTNNKFPDLTGPDGSVVAVQTDSEQFRINDAFNAQVQDDNHPKTAREFYFRLSNTHIYYSALKNDINVLGAIEIKNIRNVNEKEDFTPCFTIQDTENNDWKICSADSSVIKNWVCSIKKTLNIPDSRCQGDVNNTPVIEEKVFQPIILIPIPSKMCNDGWNYHNHGSDWNCVCAEGKEQSPIDLPEPKKAIQSPVEPIFKYERVSSIITTSTLDGAVGTEGKLKIIYSQNAVRILSNKFGKLVTLDGAVYDAEEVVFHTPSEHTIGGKRYPMEMQIIHYGRTEGDIAKQAVLSFLFERKPGVYNKFIEDINFFDLPSKYDKEKDVLADAIYIPKLFYNSDTENQSYAWKNFSFFTYQGSLTAPPCTERTIHYVAGEPLPISSSVLQLFQEALRVPDVKDDKGNIFIGDRNNENNRNTQPLNSRAVYFFDRTKHCQPETKTETVIPFGHYEKVINKSYDYYYVKGNQSSGLPGAILVPKEEAKAIEDIGKEFKQ